MSETEQRYHSNKQEFLALKSAVTDQFHEYLSPYGKNRNEFVVQTDNNLLTKARAAPYLSCKNDSGGQAWLVTSGTASENVVSVRNLRPPHLWPL